MFSWLFNMYIDVVEREGGGTTQRRSEEGREWEVNQLLFGDDTVIVADSEKKLHCLVGELEGVSEGKKLNVNAREGKVLQISVNEEPKLPSPHRKDIYRGY